MDYSLLTGRGTIMNSVYFIREDRDFTRTEQKIINFIIENPESFIHMTIGEVARHIGTSDPTISRFARHCGYDDFKGLKNSVFEHISGEGDHSPAGKLISTIGKLNSAAEEGAPGTPENFLRHQQFCIETATIGLDRLFCRDDVDRIKNFAYNEGKQTAYYGSMIGVIIRDKYFESKGIQPSEVDDNDPTR